MKLTKNFWLREFHCKDGTKVPQHLIPHVERLARALQVVRERTGCALKINSGYRTQEHNKAVGGSPRSYHLYGRAADVAPPGGVSVEMLYEHFLLAIKLGEIPDGGLGLYDTFVHYDQGRPGRRWDNRSEKDE